METDGYPQREIHSSLSVEQETLGSGLQNLLKVEDEPYTLLDTLLETH